MHYELRGENIEICAVLLHGTAPAASVDPLARACEGLCTWAVVDLPGYGASEQLADRSPEAVVDAVAELVGQLPHDDVFLVGHSFGGYLALATALRAAERLRGIVLLGPSFGVEPAEHAGYQGLAEALRAGIDITDVALERMLAPAFAAANPDACEIVRNFYRGAHQASVADDIDTVLRAPKLGEELAAVTVPVRIVVGDRDLPTPPDEVSENARVLKQAELTVLPGVGHTLCIEALDDVSSIVREFISAHRATHRLS